MSQAAQVRIGTSGWVYKHWRNVFYPPKLAANRWFEHYFCHFDTVEINCTFYGLPAASTFARWAEQAPSGFVYAVKANKILTHLKRLHEPREVLETMLDRARELGQHLGPILYQLPPHWGCDIERLRQFISVLPVGLEHVFEFRDPSWLNNDVKALLADTGMNFCIHDLAGFPCPLCVTGPIAYVRFHGPMKAKHVGRYTPQQLREWAARIAGFQRAGHAVYAYFNNDAEGHAVINARELQHLLRVKPLSGIVESTGV
ncbi:MAG TPA: DUF72 domain-containing protein [Gemmataceae bacterium]|nr:DUF72 domain-containing protein [Gemmataceae bacterium]